MSYEEAEKRANELGYEVHTFNSNRNWFSALKHWEYTGQTISLQVWIESNEFEFNRMEGAIQITTGKLGSFDNDVHFLSWQKSFMQVIEKLVN